MPAFGPNREFHSPPLPSPVFFCRKTCPKPRAAHHKLPRDPISQNLGAGRRSSPRPAAHRPPEFSIPNLCFHLVFLENPGPVFLPKTLGAPGFFFRKTWALLFLEKKPVNPSFSKSWPQVSPKPCRKPGGPRPLLPPPLKTLPLINAGAIISPRRPRETHGIGQTKVVRFSRTGPLSRFRTAFNNEMPPAPGTRTAAQNSRPRPGAPFPHPPKADRQSHRPNPLHRKRIAAVHETPKGPPLSGRFRPFFSALRCGPPGPSPALHVFRLMPPPLN